MMNNEQYIVCPHCEGKNYSVDGMFSVCLVIHASGGNCIQCEHCHEWIRDAVPNKIRTEPKEGFTISDRNIIFK